MKDLAAHLATEHDARTLAAALVARLCADGHKSVAHAVETALANSGFIDVNPPHPHREGAVDADFINGNPPHPHRGGTADSDFINGTPPSPHRGGAADSSFIDPTPPNPHRST